MLAVTPLLCAPPCAHPSSLPRCRSQPAQVEHCLGDGAACAGLAGSHHRLCGSPRHQVPAPGTCHSLRGVGSGHGGLRSHHSRHLLHPPLRAHPQVHTASGERRASPPLPVWCTASAHPLLPVQGRKASSRGKCPGQHRHLLPEQGRRACTLQQYRTLAKTTPANQSPAAGPGVHVVHCAGAHSLSGTSASGMACVSVQLPAGRCATPSVCA